MTRNNRKTLHATVDYEGRDMSASQCGIVNRSFAQNPAVGTRDMDRVTCKRCQKSLAVMWRKLGIKRLGEYGDKPLPTWFG